MRAKKSVFNLLSENELNKRELRMIIGGTTSSGGGTTTTKGVGGGKDEPDDIPVGSSSQKS